MRAVQDELAPAEGMCCGRPFHKPFSLRPRRVQAVAVSLLALFGPLINDGLKVDISVWT